MKKKVKGRECVMCGKSIAHRRLGARTCGRKCRVALSRAIAREKACGTPQDALALVHEAQAQAGRLDMSAWHSYRSERRRRSS